MTFGDSFNGQDSVVLTPEKRFDSSIPDNVNSYGKNLYLIEYKKFPNASIHRFVRLAQLVEQLLYTEKVESSSLSFHTIRSRSA